MNKKIVNQGEEEQQVIEPQEVEQEEALEVEPEQAEVESEAEIQGEEESADDDELVIAIDGVQVQAQEEADNKAPDWVRELRNSNRELKKKNKELEAKLSAVATTTETPAIQPAGKKPELSDFGYDSEQYEAELLKWVDRKRQEDDAKAQAEAERKKQEEAWQSKVGSYQKAKESLPVKDFDEAESSVQELMDVTQQGIIVDVAENPAMVIYALGKNPEKAKALASIKNPTHFIYALAQFEQKELTVTSKKKTIPKPETVPSGAAKMTSGDSTLEALRKEAERTGDYSKVAEYKRRNPK